MPTVRYTVMDGEIVSENRNGTVRDYVPDPLGSTIALLDQNQNITDTFSYWPYGEERSRTGTTPTPFRFVGTLGYYRDSSGRTYVRAREYQQTYGRWMTVDPLWPSEGAFEYVSGQPSTAGDPSGLQCCRRNSTDCCERPNQHMKAKIDECRRCFERIGAAFLLDRYPVRMCWEVGHEDDALSNPNATPCRVELPARWALLDRDSRCKTLLHELLHCYCNFFVHTFPSEEEYDKAHMFIYDWSTYSVMDCYYGPLGTQPKPRFGPPPRLPSNVCDLIRRGTSHPRIRRKRRGSAR